MAVIYCFGIPAVALYTLNLKKEAIQKLQLLSESVEELERDGTLEHVPDAPPNGETHPKKHRKTIQQHRLLSDAKTLRSHDKKSKFSDKASVWEDHEAGVAQIDDLLWLEAKIKEDDALLAGLSPLYKDYESEYWWFEVCPFLFFLFF